jgi:hypothetical protein
MQWVSEAEQTLALIMAAPPRELLAASLLLIGLAVAIAFFF